MSSSEVRPRRWLQFSLRTLFVLMLVVAAFFGGRESMRRAFEAERAKARAMHKLAEVERAERIRAVEERLQYQMQAQMHEAMLRLRTDSPLPPAEKTP